MKNFLSPNQLAIAQATNELSQWHNDNGTQPFYPDTLNDLGQQAYHDPGRGPVEISEAHILQVSNSGAAATVTLFGSYTNRTATNFGNAVAITVTYLLTGFTYAQLLAQTESKPMQVGMVRIEGTTSAQVTNPVTITEQVGIGRTNTAAIIPLTSPYQQINTVTYVQKAFKIDGNISLAYTHSATPEVVKWYFYASETISLSRALSDRKLVQEYTAPSTGPIQEFQAMAPRVGAGNALRSNNLI